MIEEALSEARRLAHDNRLEGKNLDEVDELEDDEDHDFLEQYRWGAKNQFPSTVLFRLTQVNCAALTVCSNQRLEELSTIQFTSIYNQVYPLQKVDYLRDVTETSFKTYVLVLLTSSLGLNTESNVLANIWRTLAGRFGDLKFCQMRADLCIEGYPEKNTPTVLIYKGGDIKRQIVTLRELRGIETTVNDLEETLVNIGAVKRGDPRLQRQEKETPPDRENGKIRRGIKSVIDDEDDSDWE